VTELASPTNSFSSRLPRLPRVARRLVGGVAFGLALVGLGTVTTPVPTASGISNKAITTAPLTTAFVQGDETWLVVPMGHLSDFVNTFWQLFVRTGGGWKTVTPPGVADNGGLVITDGPNGSLLAGFLGSQDLTFSPLSMSTDVGNAWTPVYFPEGLISAPDALGGNTAGPMLGLGRSGGGDLLEEGAGLSSWRSVTTVGRLRRSSAGTRCYIKRLTATGVAPDGDLLVGAACLRPGVVGLFDVTGGLTGTIAFAGSSTLSRATVSVLRLVPTATGTAILLGAREPNGRTVLLAGSFSGSTQPVTLSAPLEVAPGTTPLASGTTPAGGLFVLLQPTGGGAPELADVTAGTEGMSAWNVLPSPPRGTLGAAFSNGRIDAVAVHSSTLVDYVFDPLSGTWLQSQLVHVPIQYGSSS